MNTPERFVDVANAAEFLSCSPRYLMDLARRAAIPAHPLGTGTRRVWRFKLSELESALCHREGSLTVPEEGRAKGTRQSTKSENGQ